MCRPTDVNVCEGKVEGRCQKQGLLLRRSDFVSGEQGDVEATLKFVTELPCQDVSAE